MSVNRKVTASLGDMVGAPAFDPDWSAQAACAGEDPDIFFPDSPGGGVGTDEVALSKARRICADCPVRVDCLREAVKRNHAKGVFGYLTQYERTALVNLAEKQGLDIDDLMGTAA